MQAIDNLKPCRRTFWQTPLEYECLFHSSISAVLAYQGFLDRKSGHDATGEGSQKNTLGHEAHAKGEQQKMCVGATCSITFHPLQEKPRYCIDTRPPLLVTGQTGRHQHAAQLPGEAGSGRIPSGEDFFIILHNSTSHQLL